MVRKILKYIALIGVFLFISSQPPTGLTVGFLFIFLALYLQDHVNRITKLENLKPVEKDIIKFTVNPNAAIVRNKRFGELVGLKTNTKEFKDWSKTDTNKLWDKGGIREKLKDKLFGASFTYLPGENAYFVKDNSNYSNIISRKFVKTSLYFQSIIEDHLYLEIYERIPNFNENLLSKRIPMQEQLVYLFVCLKYQAKELPSKEDEFTILCEIPLLYFINRELLGEEKWKEQYKKAANYIEKAGVKVESDSFPDMPMKDDFGEEPEHFSTTTYWKNGVEIRFF